MNDPYTSEMKAHKQSSLEAELDNDTANKAKEIEQQNYKKAHAARKKLQEAEAVHKQTTKELELQNEKLENVKHSKIAEEADKARENAIKFENEKNAFNPLSGAACAFKQFKSDMNDGKVRRMSHDNNDVGIGMEASEDSVTHAELKDNSNATKEEKTTNDELRKMLKSLKNIKKENKIQSMHSKKQESNLTEILKTSEDAKKSVKKTENMLKKDNFEK